MLRLQWADIDRERGFIHIKDPKGGQSQVIPLNEGAAAIMDALPENPSPFVFPGKAGQQRKQISKALRTIKEAAWLPKSFRALHGLRHVYASMLASSGKVDLFVLQRLLTHKDSRMTMRYAHLRDAALRKASNVADDIISNAITGKNGKVLPLKK